jgi:hypothetical protein
VRAGGYFSPIYTKRRASPEYVVLIDRRHDGDHLARYSCALVEALEHAGVHLVVYYFDHDPRRATLGPGQRILDLDDLAMLQHSHRLILFSDGSGLCDMATGQLHPWALRFAEWPRSALLTPKDIASWGRLEWLIESECSMPVLPATKAGLLLVARLFDPETPVVTAMPHRPQALMPDFNRLDGFFAIGTWRWVDDIEPPTDTVDALLERLHTGLTVAAFDWLRALAVYPAVYWSLTLFLGSKLTGEDGKSLCTAGSMLEIARLPWLEHGRMPDWLRKRLILDMPPDLRERVHSVLESLLLTVVSRNPKDFTIAMVPLAGEETRRTAQPLDRDEQRQDAILIEFMTRREASPTDFRFHSKVATALGLPRVRSAFRNLFGHSELEAMRAAAQELWQFMYDTPFAKVTTHFIDPSIFGPDVRALPSYVTRSGDPVPLSRPLYLLKRNPNKRFSVLLDQHTLNLWVRRKRLTFRFSLWSCIALSIILGIVYAPFFDAFLLDKLTNALSLGGKQGNKLVGLHMLRSIFLATIIYIPFPIFWFLLLCPFSQTLRRFPRIADEHIQKLERLQALEGLTPAAAATVDEHIRKLEHLQAEWRWVVREVWFGQRPLAQTFWWWFILIEQIFGNYIVPFLMILLLSNFKREHSNFLFYLYVAFWILYVIWVRVGLWRSATNNPGFWARIVKIIVLLSMGPIFSLITSIFIIRFVVILVRSFRQWIRTKMRQPA